jgi:hypothetical protein
MTDAAKVSETLHPDFDFIDWPPETDKEETNARAFVSIVNFGDREQSQALCEMIINMTDFHPVLNSAGIPVIQCRVRDLGGMMVQFASMAATNWIEYTIQFEC